VEEKSTHSSQQPANGSQETASLVERALSQGPILAVDGQGLKRLIQASLTWLRHHQAAINALNVFPVPDGDTGTNMLLTMQSVWAEIADSPEQNAGAIAQSLAHGALMGARGNSGVILSQLWRGFARSLGNKQTFAAADLAQAMQEAADTAYKGVIKPVEGTILTVAREAANAAHQITREQGDLVVALDYIVGQTRQAVARTPSQLAVLAEAGVVDAGGQGFYTILEGMLRYLRGETVAVDEALDTVVDLGVPVPVAVEPDHVMVEHDHEIGYGYDVQFIIVSQGLEVDTIRDDIDAMGDSTLVVGDPTAVKVHVHVPDPGVPLSYAVRLGSLRDVVVEDMQAQYQEFILGRSAPPVAAPSQLASEVSTVVVAPGRGLAEVFKSLGVSEVVSGGQTMNPSTQQLLEAVEALPTDQVIILPNNKNIVMAAKQAAELAHKTVKVVATRTIPQGIAAVLAFNYQADLQTNVDLMRAAAQEVESGEITTATRSVELDGVQVQEGDIIGLVNERLVASGSTIEQVVWRMMEEMALADLEMLTLYYGDGIQPEKADLLAAKIQERYPEQEIEVVAGDQPHYHYIISAE
jgi:DAK2 domain fusion protein YloV